MCTLKARQTKRPVAAATWELCTVNGAGMFPSPHAQPLPHGCLGPLVLQHPPAAPSCGSAHFFIAHPHLHPQPLSVLLSPQLQAGPGDSPTSVLPRFCVKEAIKRVNWSAGGIAAGSAAGMCF